ncbi:hypothetical protein E2C01_045573 [Portunus trituberculatus]|uniref:Uncharacterized protein n=1 Tax=Portunus trituberculatus TaxID=210409 RepID=A0A5B7FW44_PORTR|nr:hypothetical protein [Portunus trituberculatus]
MCSAKDQCDECSHLSLLQFQAYVKDAKEKKQAKLSSSSSEKCSRRHEPASEAPWASKFVAVESDLAAMKASIAQLPAVLLPPASSSVFSGFADGGASVRLPPLVTGVRGPWFPPNSGPSVEAAGSSGMSFSVTPLPVLALGVSGGQAPSVPSSIPELTVGGVSLRAAQCSAPLPVLSGVPSPAVPTSSMEFSGLGGVSMCVAFLPSLALGVRGVQSPAVSGSSAEFSGFRGVSLSAAPLSSMASAVSVVQTPAVSGASREFSGLSGMSLCAAPLPSVAPGLSGLQAPANSDSSMAGPGVSGLSLCATPLSGKASGVCGEPAPAGPVSSLGLVGGGETGLRGAPLPGGLPGDGNFAGSAGISSMALPHVDLLHGSMSLQVLPQPVDVGMDPGGTVVSQAAATGWPLFSEEVDEVFDDVPSREAGTLDEEGAASFCELITSVREFLGLSMPSSIASTLQTGVERTSESS